MFPSRVFNRWLEVISLIFVCAYACQAAERSFKLELGTKIGGNKKVVERYWKPRSLEVDQGDRVTIDLTNSKALLAGNITFSLDGYPSAWTKVKMGKHATAAFVADKIGEFRFNCNVPGCSAGTLTVKPRPASPQQTLVPPA
ncbi:MAG: cupredoxin domain-containing protein, partial [Elusimicrobia bacterium]|nr:cupredoxin domain-containing protein [Elusimicrobiota bacterium]